MDILLIAPEIAPYSRSGELGDVCAALPKGLRSVGHKVTVVSPLWGGIDATARALARRLSGVEVSLGSDKLTCTIHDGRTTGGVELVFIGHAELFGAAQLASAGPREALVFAQAAAQLVAGREPAPEVVHAHGAFAAAALPLIAAAKPSCARVLSLHDVADQGSLAGANVALPDAVRELSGGPNGSLLRAGIAAAQRVIARSQAEAATLLQGDAGGLRALLEGKLTGILGGLDAARWNPITDPLLVARYDAVNKLGKERCKGALQLELGLPVRPEVPLITCVIGDAGLAPLVGKALATVLHNDVQVVISGADPSALDASELAQRYTERLVFAADGSEKALHRMIASADLLLVPGTDGELHMVGQRYGAPPIAPDQPPVCDAVVDCDAAMESGTGFLFEPGKVEDVIASVQRALAAFTKREAFEQLQTRVMRLDLSWERSARSYEHVYKTAASAPR